jgi:branched-chain amino acid transport system substrate-binding protein
LVFSTRRGARLALVATALLFVCSSPIAAYAAVHQSPSPIQIGGDFPMTGSVSPISLQILAGYKLAFSQVNATGGVKGASINYTTVDDGYNPSQTVPKIKQLVESDHVLAIAGIFGSDESNQAVSYLKTKKVPFFDPIGGGADVAGDPWIWQTEPSYAQEGTIMGHYIAKTLKVKKVAVIYQQGVNEPEIATLKKWFTSSNFVDYSYASTATDVDLAPYVTDVINFNPQMVILLGTLIPTADFVKDATANGFKPSKGWFANYPQGDPTWLALTAACSCLQGSHVSSYADLTGHNPVAKAYAAAIKKYDPSQTNTNYGLYGYFNGTLLSRALKFAVKKGPLTADRLQTAFNTDFRNYKSGFTGVLNWTPSYRYGVKQFKIYKIKGSQFIPVTGWISK